VTGVKSTDGLGTSGEIPPSNGSFKVTYKAPPAYKVIGPALAGFENTNRVEQVIEGLPVDYHTEPKSEVERILSERGKRYGTFKSHARVAQGLKHVIERELLNLKPRPLDDDMKQALDVICDKIARIINGDENYVDNWDDIAGYATLVSKRLQGKTGL
jgi:Domain of unknown function (DUF6378)